MIESGNLFAGIPDTLAAEQLTALLTTPNVRIERIVSRGHASPPGFLVRSAAGGVGDRAGPDRPPSRSTAKHRRARCRSGDHLHIPAHTRHRVVSTDADEPTILDRSAYQ